MTTQPIASTQTETIPEPLLQPLTVRKILVALDQSPAAPKVFNQALSLATAYQSKLKILSCIANNSPTVAMAPGDFLGAEIYGVDTGTAVAIAEQQMHKSLEDLQLWLQQYAEVATRNGVPTEFDYFCGEPGPSICAAAQEWGSDMVVVGRRGRKGLSEILLGSVSNYVLHHAPCSVLTVQGQS
ncbi:universal stress protein [Prochlorothrix hollandica]|uniref:universal stress protein n=1 Tax=Prochlorothrix hollandica TaxID=1223 RepID=UPI003341E1FC